MMQMPMYAAQWEWELATRGRRLAEAERIWRTRMIWSASKARQPKKCSWFAMAAEKLAFKKLRTFLGHTGA